MNEEKQYKFKNYVIGYDKGFRDKSAFTICEKKEDYLLVTGTLYDKSADILDEWLEHLHLENERLNNIIKRLETDLYDMYITFGEFNEEYSKNRIKELKGSDKE